MSDDSEKLPQIGKKVAWGMFLILIGSAFLLDRLGLVDLPSLGRLWPLVPVVIGFSNLVDGKVGGGVTMILIGGWLMASNEGWFDLHWGNSWPLALVAVGFGIVIKALTGEDARDRRGCAS